MQAASEVCPDAASRLAFEKMWKGVCAGPTLDGIRELSTVVDGVFKQHKLKDDVRAHTLSFVSHGSA